MSQVKKAVSTESEELVSVEDVVRELARKLVDNPALVEVKAVYGRSTVLIEVQTSAADTKRLIGRKGRTADALRHLLNCMGAVEGLNYNLWILEPEERVQERHGDRT